MAPSEFARGVLDLGHHIAVFLDRREASEQGGVISGDNPTHFNESNPIRIWIIQLVIIICTTQLLSVILARLRQPRVIAEVIGGVILGPTIMGRIPNFSNVIFPPKSLPFLNLTATVGLVLFLFLVGLEIDVRVVKRNAKTSTIISLAGLILPFGLGAAIAIPIYREFIDPSVEFGHFLLFVGVAVAITAFPVLCRILTELRLLDTTVGVIVLSAGVGNDVVGWVLLALAVALANSSAGLTALWVLLAATGWTLFMLLPVRWAFFWLARRTGSLEDGAPTAFMMVVTLLIVFISAFMTDILGVHAIFGGFIAGLIIPHDGGFAIALVEKLEDLVSLLFLPLYFTLSGLRTNFGYLDTGISWGYTVLICCVAFFESATIGVLMSCKGLVELIVLNIGLQAGILNTRVFSMFVLHALVLTVITTPGTLWLYPAHRRVHFNGAEKSSGTEEKGGEAGAVTSTIPCDDDLKKRFSIILSKIEHIPAMMAITHLLQPARDIHRLDLTLIPSTSTYQDSVKAPESTLSPTESKTATKPTVTSSLDVRMEVLRLMELTGRPSAVMRSYAAEEQRDPLIAISRTFGHLNCIPVGSSLSMVPLEDFPSTIAQHAEDHNSEMVVIPWAGEFAMDGPLPDDRTEQSDHNPFDVFGKSRHEKAPSVVYSQLIRSIFQKSPTDVAVVLDHGISHLQTQHGSYGHHIILPFFGGPDDRLALSFAVQLGLNQGTTVSIIRLRKTEVTGTYHGSPNRNNDTLPTNSVNGFPDTVYAPHSTSYRMASETADNIAWARYTSDTSISPLVDEARKRVKFTSVEVPDPLHYIANHAQEELKRTTREWKNLVIVTGRARRMAAESHHDELKKIVTERPNNLATGVEVTRRTVGEVATGLLCSGVRVSMIVVQAAEEAS